MSLILLIKKLGRSQSIHVLDVRLMPLDWVTILLGGIGVRADFDRWCFNLVSVVQEVVLVYIYFSGQLRFLSFY